jgi:hypothetical protein
VTHWLNLSHAGRALMEAEGQDDVLYATFLLFSDGAGALLSTTQQHVAMFDGQSRRILIPTGIKMKSLFFESESIVLNNTIATEQ